MHLFFSVGEPSGDQHAAHLIRELQRLRPDVRASGYGGPLMQQAGCRLNYRLTDLAVMGFSGVVPLLRQFRQLVHDAGVSFQESRPDAVILVDFPGFNWWIARKAKAAGIPVFYYLPPQLWAWASWRVRRMRKFVDHVLCSLPFEPDWYHQRQVKADYVGHPFFDEVADYPLDQTFCANWSSGEVRTVGILPGSRDQEITRIWPMMLDIMSELHARHKNVRFLVACYKRKHYELCRSHMKPQHQELPLYWFVGKTPEVIQVAECCLMVSGSVSLEMLARKTPAVVIYRVSRLLYALARPVANVDSMTLPNLIAGETVLPEWLAVWSTKRVVQQSIATLDEWLSDDDKLRQKTAELSRLHDQLVQIGATSRTAQIILDRLPQPAPQRKAA